MTAPPCVREWSDEWHHPCGDVVQWYIRYEYPSRGESDCSPDVPPIADRLLFQAIVFPAPVAEKVRKGAADLRR
jgi:hypothetical protein